MKKSTEATTLRLSRPAVPDSVTELRHAARDCAVRLGVERPDDVALAVSEAATNAVLHAYPPGTNGTILLAIDADRDGCRVMVSDEGVGLRPRPDSPGLGLGLPLMAQLADRIDIADGTGHGVHVKMVFTLSSPPR